MTAVRLLLIWRLALAFSASVSAAPLAITIHAPPPAETGYFKLGAARNPAGHEISINSRCLLWDGQPVFPVMGEFHYSRCPPEEWREELLKMKAGGVDIVSTYVFWIHHEEIEGQWDWSGQRDLHQFIQTCGQLGLKAVVRCGPWCHGEVRNGGLPDWVETKGWKTRSTDPRFLAAVQPLYEQIARQLQGQLWKDGGPVIGVQLDNEFGGSPDYLMALKKLAIQAGLDVPLYLKTGWPAMRRPVPLGEMLPMFGCYGDGFWSRSLQPMDGADWEGYLFKRTRTDTGIGADVLGARKAGDAAGTEKYPYFTCEVGGGMAASYHRRINLDSRDVEAVALTQLGSGSSLLGYYMYHGGQNPDGKLTTLQESLTSGYGGYNDLPVKNYDFAAPLGEYGQVNAQYHWLRRLHLFLEDFGGTLANYPCTLPDLVPTNKNDLATLRWSVRSDGASGYVFVNNYQRLQPMPPKKGVQFQLSLPGGPLAIPSQPLTIPADECFFWPFNLQMGGALLIYATAQPVCHYENEGGKVYFFAATPGVAAEFVFSAANGPVRAISGKERRLGNEIHIQNVKRSRDAAIVLNDRVKIVLLDDADSLRLWRAEGIDGPCLLLTDGNVVPAGDARLRVAAADPRDLALEMFPAAASMGIDSAPGRTSHHERCPAKPDGLFARFQPTIYSRAPIQQPRVGLAREAGPAREIHLSKGKPGVAEAPADADFTNAAVWKILLPKDLELNDNPRLRINYVGDVARITLNGKLLDDQFYNGRSFELGLKRYAPEIFSGDLRLEVLPLRRDAPIYLSGEAKAAMHPADRAAAVKRVEVVKDYSVTFSP